MNLAWRLSLLILVMAVVAFVDWLRHRSLATKWREYGFLLASGLLGGAFGIAVDQLTATISPEYFVFGKGLAADHSFRLSVAALGFQAGLAAGIVIGGGYLIANNPKPGRWQLPHRRLFRFAVPPIVWAAIMAAVVSPLVTIWDPLDIRGTMADVLAPAQQTHFLIVWGIHLGLYLGGAIGAVQGVVAIRRRRASVASPDSSENVASAAARV